VIQGINKRHRAETAKKILVCELAKLASKVAMTVTSVHDGSYHKCMMARSIKVKKASRTVCLSGTGLIVTSCHTTSFPKTSKHSPATRLNNLKSTIEASKKLSRS
jgi:diphthamide synthase subunit DPH2